ncbi:MAG: hypothetical protein A2277_07605 [Desulfobacterales bacterium RIFOXYA12_FULL_46_15]|nr:MAG: hypothetical protein A2097_14740 [Desulfobacula sp. GWF2_41_7]OGR28530.1 MAG: hypothetical protein A2277_07605 [Desulfobacterales bacterium RIFOXYA12_FULL_46_15]
MKNDLWVFCISHTIVSEVNEEKSAVSRPWLRKFLGFTYFQMCGQSKIRLHAKSMKRFKDKVQDGFP